MGRVGVAGYSGIDQSSPNDRGDVVDQGMLDTAVRDVNHSVGTELKQTQFRRAEAAPNGEPRAKSKPRGLSGNHRNLR
jgi:hypothetical protein